jgi:hypothetical protein
LYGGHLSQAVINNIIAPKEESRDLVMQWLNSEGLGEYSFISPRQDSVIVQASINQIEKLLNAEYSPYGMWKPPYRKAQPSISWIVDQFLIIKQFEQKPAS